MAWSLKTKHPRILKRHHKSFRNSERGGNCKKSDTWKAFRNQVKRFLHRRDLRDGNCNLEQAQVSLQKPIVKVKRDLLDPIEKANSVHRSQRKGASSYSQDYANPEDTGIGGFKGKRENRLFSRHEKEEGQEVFSNQASHLVKGKLPVANPQLRNERSYNLCI